MTSCNNRKVCLQGHFDVPDNRLEAIKAALPEHIALSRAETGCLSFDVVQSDRVPGRFLVSEVFADRAAFEAHQTRSRASEWFKTADGIPRTYKITGDDT